MSDVRFLIQDLENKLQRLIYLKKKLVEENRVLEQELEQKKESLSQLKNEMQELKSAKSNALIALTLENKEEIHTSRKKIDEMVREIDRCLSLINMK